MVRETGRGQGPLEDVGYVLTVERPHGGHTHVTVVELYLTAAHQTRFEDVLAILEERRAEGVGNE